MGQFIARMLASGFVGLIFVRVENPDNHRSKFSLQLLASRRVLEFNAFAFATNQASFPKSFEVLIGSSRVENNLESAVAITIYKTLPNRHLESFQKHT